MVAKIGTARANPPRFDIKNTSAPETLKSSSSFRSREASGRTDRGRLYALWSAARPR